MAMELPFVIIEPENEFAKAAFSDAYETLTSGRQGAAAPAARNMAVESETRYNRDVMLFKHNLLAQKKNARDDGNMSDTPPEPDTDEEDELRHLGMIWSGRYALNMNVPPRDASIGWAMGILSNKDTDNDIVLCTHAFAKKHNLHVKILHARFNFDLQNRAFCISSKTSQSLTKVAVNGTMIADGQIYSLNQATMLISIGPLLYKLRYTHHASTDAFLAQRQTYMGDQMKLSTPVVFDMPTPSPAVKILGQWILGEVLGKGSSGKVLLGTNWRNEMVAVKIMECNHRTRNIVNAEIKASREITALIKEHEEEGRIVRLRELIDPRMEGNPLRSGFADVALVLEPMTPLTLTQVLDEEQTKRSGRPLGATTTQLAVLFRDALSGIKFLHDHGYVHRDIKPANIGVRAGRAVILDIGQAMHLRRGVMIYEKPGSGGTNCFLAPEREMTIYGQPADIWALGCVGFHLTYGYHPFKFKVNPWRPGDEYEALRGKWFIFYNHAMERLAKDGDKAADRNHVYLGKLLAEMLRHYQAQTPEQRDQRVTAADALTHAAWGANEPQEKKSRN